MVNLVSLYLLGKHKQICFIISYSFVLDLFFFSKQFLSPFIYKIFSYKNQSLELI